MENIAAKKIVTPLSTFTVSARGKSRLEPIGNFLKTNFASLPLSQIESIFGFVERSTLYGGRAFQQRQLSNSDVLQLNEWGIGVRIPMTNHFATRDEYQQNKRILQKYHKPLNSIICTNDDLAQWIRNDFLIMILKRV
ncbi:hypothetical protein [Shewanella atlantica]|uniref:hypothetical protein n=1 Tax=Shewanella atlantica TaxID=271099 RepID=UPI001FEC640F|nr:hypothetical protein [Shewanella atlantica]